MQITGERGSGWRGSKAKDPEIRMHVECLKNHQGASVAEQRVGA